MAWALWLCILPLRQVLLYSRSQILKKLVVDSEGAAVATECAQNLLCMPIRDPLAQFGAEDRCSTQPLDVWGVRLLIRGGAGDQVLCSADADFPEYVKYNWKCVMIIKTQDVGCFIKSTVTHPQHVTSFRSLCLHTVPRFPEEWLWRHLVLLTGLWYHLLIPIPFQKNPDWTIWQPSTMFNWSGQWNWESLMLKVRFRTYVALKTNPLSLFILIGPKHQRLLRICPLTNWELQERLLPVQVRAFYWILLALKLKALTAWTFQCKDAIKHEMRSSSGPSKMAEVTKLATKPENEGVALRCPMFWCWWRFPAVIFWLLFCAFIEN